MWECSLIFWEMNSLFQLTQRWLFLYCSALSFGIRSAEICFFADSQQLSTHSTVAMFQMKYAEFASALFSFSICLVYLFSICLRFRGMAHNRYYVSHCQQLYSNNDFLENAFSVDISFSNNNIFIVCLWFTGIQIVLLLKQKNSCLIVTIIQNYNCNKNVKLISKR